MKIRKKYERKNLIFRKMTLITALIEVMPNEVRISP